MSKPTLATVWLDGCSGCHMSFLDLDERLLDVLSRFDLVYSPLIDVKTFPRTVDVTLVEGAVGGEEDLARIRRVRASTRLLVALGDCGVTGNVPALRNAVGVKAVMDAGYPVADRRAWPLDVVPPLLRSVRPIHEVVTVDLNVPGCPPPADVIGQVLRDLSSSRIPDISGLTRFGK